MHHSASAALQEELERDAEVLKKDLVETRLLAQKELVLDPEAEMFEVCNCAYLVEIHIAASRAYKVSP